MQFLCDGILLSLEGSLQKGFGNDIQRELLVGNRSREAYWSRVTMFRGSGGSFDVKNYVWMIYGRFDEENCVWMRNLLFC